MGYTNTHTEIAKDMKKLENSLFKLVPENKGPSTTPLRHLVLKVRIVIVNYCGMCYSLLKIHLRMRFESFSERIMMINIILDDLNFY